MSKQIDEIMDWFDFATCQKVMDFLDWQWRDEGVPSESMLREEARRLLNIVSKEKGPFYTACGGLCATKHVDGALALAFVLRDLEAEGDEA